MAFDFKAVADAIAVRFGPATVSPPSGETAIRLATANLPNAIAAEPSVVVFPPEVDFSYGPSLIKAEAVYPVRFYIFKIRDTPRNAVLIYKWINALYATLTGQVHLGLAASGVTHSVVSSFTPGDLTAFNGERFYGVEFTVTVYLAEGMNAGA